MFYEGKKQDESIERGIQDKWLRCAERSAPVELAAKLRAANLYPMMPTSADKIEDAWLPSKAHTMLSLLYRQ